MILRQVKVVATKGEKCFILALCLIIGVCLANPTLSANAAKQGNLPLFVVAATILETLFTMDLTGKKFPYRRAKLRIPKDITKRWFIEFYAWNEDKNSLTRFKFDFNLNQIENLKERKKEAQSLINKIDKHLLNGEVISRLKKELQPANDNNFESNFDILTFKKGIEQAAKFKAKGKRGKSVSTYESFQKVFLEWMKKENIENMLFKYVNSITLEKFFLYLIEEKKISNRTYDNYLIYITSLFNFYKNKDLITKNPCASIERLKYDEGRNVAFNKTQVAQLKEALNKFDPQLWIFCQWLYYSGVRPGELRQLKIKDIGEKKIFVASEVSKGRRNGYVTITPGLKKIIESMKLSNYTTEDYLFSKAGKPGRIQVSRDYFNKKHKEVLKELQYSNEYTLYSWKHTGVVDLCLSGVNIKFIQFHLRHTELETTDKYLKSLGIQIDSHIEEELINKAPTI